MPIKNGVREDEAAYLEEKRGSLCLFDHRNPFRLISKCNCERESGNQESHVRPTSSSTVSVGHRLEKLAEKSLGSRIEADQISR